MEASETSNDIAWEKAFSKYSINEVISEKGSATISADQLREFREPRLMAKIDHSQNLPKIFKKHNLAILSISNSKYKIGPFTLYQKLPEWKTYGPDVSLKKIPEEIESLDGFNISSENGVLFSLILSGIFSDFVKEDVRATVAGRMRTPKFEFLIENRLLGKEKLMVDRTQIEIDAGLEGIKSFYLLEIKNNICQDFNMRQLFYPYVLWKSRINKSVRTIFVNYSNDIFSMSEFAWHSVADISSVELINVARYSLTKRKDEKVSLIEIALELENADTKIINEPFPQADDFERVLDLVSFLIESPRSVFDLAERYDFNPRQSDYYFNAAKFLGLADTRYDRFRIATNKANKIFTLPTDEKYLALGKILLSFCSVRKTYRYWHEKKKFPTKDTISRIIVESGETKEMSEKTLRRRAHTVASWTNWLINNLD